VGLAWGAKGGLAVLRPLLTVALTPGLV